MERFLFFLCDKLVRGEASTLTLQSSAAYIGISFFSEFFFFFFEGVAVVVVKGGVTLGSWV